MSLLASVLLRVGGIARRRKAWSHFRIA